jgi:hypothetical protein
MRRTPVGLAVASAALLAAPRARAVDPFEIQVYDGTANDPGAPGIELHLNHVALGLKQADAPELPQHNTTHLTLEPSFGLFPWWELGGYLQTAVRRDGTFDYAGVKLRSKFVTPPDWYSRDGRQLRLGVNFELSVLPERYDRDRWATEIRPIVAWDTPSWLFAVNPILDQALAGSGAEGPTFQPALMALYKVANVVSVGLEYYGNFGPISEPLSLRKQEQYIYEVVNLLAVERFELNGGLGEGLTPSSNSLVVKAIVGYAWEDAPAHSPSDRTATRQPANPK